VTWIKAEFLSAFVSLILPANAGFFLVCSLSRFSCVVSSFLSRCLSLPALLLLIAGGACAARLPLALAMVGSEGFALLAG